MSTTPAGSLGPPITLTTDFGTGSPYVAAMKGVILSIAPGARVVDLSHAIAPQNVQQGAWVLRQATPWFPADTIHVAVVDPGVGTSRPIVYARIGSQQYVAPDNGLLSFLARRQPPTTIISLENPAYWLDEVSATFHGRDIMAPVAARLSLGLDPASLGPRRSQLVELPWPEVRRMAQRIEGAVTAVDSFGNLITNITADQLADVPRGEDQVRITCGEHETFGIFRTYGDQPPMTLVAVIGSDGFLELAIVSDSAAAMLGEGVGSPVTVTWS